MPNQAREELKMIGFYRFFTRSRPENFRTFSFLPICDRPYRIHGFWWNCLPIWKWTSAQHLVLTSSGEVLLDWLRFKKVPTKVQGTRI